MEFIGMIVSYCSSGWSQLLTVIDATDVLMAATFTDE
jgi:hypothetical protein